MKLNDTIVALASPPGSGAIALVRVSGADAINFTAPFFQARNHVDLNKQKSHSLQLGYIADGERIIDESLVSVFKGTKSYTGENTVEISCHGSPFIQQEIIQLLLRNGCRAAEPGEFTMRAFLNGKMDLSQAEAVADLIASGNAASHELAMNQMRGGFANELKRLRQELLDFASLIELELDFSEEDVEFADREQFKNLVGKIQRTLNKLIDSFAIGNVIKNGIPVAIVGEPNVGKSTLLNALLNEERAIVSDIAGTTRDTIEDEIAIEGIGFRFIDTAGIRETTDTIEGLGIKRTFEKMEKSQVVVYLFNAVSIQDPSAGRAGSEFSIPHLLMEIEKTKNKFPRKPLLVIVNKIDLLNDAEASNLKKSILKEVEGSNLICISAKTGEGVEELQQKLLHFVNTGALHNQDTIVTNARHYDALLKAQAEINQVQEGLNSGLSGDLLAIDIRQALYHFGDITGDHISNDELLGNIFANFCIGK